MPELADQILPKFGASEREALLHARYKDEPVLEVKDKVPGPRAALLPAQEAGTPPTGPGRGDAVGSEGVELSATAARRLIIDSILVAAAGHEAELGSRHWTADKVKGRLANVMKARNLAAAAATALNHP